MKTTFTRSEILKGSGCYRETTGKSERIIGDSREMSITEILSLDIPLKDKFWFVRNNCQLTNDEFRKMAIGCATIVLPIYEAKYPGNKAPREAIKAAQDFLNGDISTEELREKRDAAAYAADAATYAADAATYAYAATYAADAAAYAADAAADAAAYADAYAVDDYKGQLLNFLIEFVSNK